MVLSLVSVLPRWLRHKLASVLSTHLVSRNSATNRAVRINIEACFPDLPESERERLFKRSSEYHFQANLLAPRQWFASPAAIEQKSTIVNRHILDDALANERPVILLVTHSAALDAGLLALSPSYPMVGIYNPLSNAVLDWLVLRSRRRFGATPLPRGSGFRQIIRSMRDGNIMCYLGDEDLGKDSAVFAPFFNRRKATLTLLPRLAKATGAIVIPMIAHHDPSKDGVKVQLLEPIEHFPSGDMLADTGSMNAAIERTIRLDPAQFTWKLRVFKTCPNDQGTRYGQIERGELSIEEL